MSYTCIINIHGDESDSYNAAMMLEKWWVGEKVHITWEKNRIIIKGVKTEGAAFINLKELRCHFPKGMIDEAIKMKET